MGDQRWRPVAGIDAVRIRARMLKRIRAFFDARDVLEVETPLLASSAVTDPHLESLSTVFAGRAFYLNTSPEYCMKRMLAEHGQAIYQVCKAFRRDELGVTHNPEFTMLEWYRPDFDMYQLMREINELLCFMLEVESLNVLSLSYRQAFTEYAGLDPHSASAEKCRETAVHYGINVPVGLDDDIDGWLDWLLTQLVLPALPSNMFTFIYDYPQSQCALAQLRLDQKGVMVASRFELFYGEIELANGFHELQSSEIQRQRFNDDNMTRRREGQTEVLMDELLLDALAAGLPDCSGVALGLDRLLMMMTGKRAIEEVLNFPWDRV